MPRDFHCTECKGEVCSPHDDYMVTNSVWATVHPEGYKGCLCMSCLDMRTRKVMGRALTAQDFTPVHCFVNAMLLSTDEPAPIVKDMLGVQTARCLQQGLPLIPTCISR